MVKPLIQGDLYSVPRPIIEKGFIIVGPSNKVWSKEIFNNIPRAYDFLYKRLSEIFKDEDLVRVEISGYNFVFGERVVAAHQTSVVAGYTNAGETYRQNKKEAKPSDLPMQALKAIASCNSYDDGDVVSIARKTLLSLGHPATWEDQQEKKEGKI